MNYLCQHYICNCVSWGTGSICTDHRYGTGITYPTLHDVCVTSGHIIMSVSSCKGGFTGQSHRVQYHPYMSSIISSVIT